jgi:hypothetical protein
VCIGIPGWQIKVRSESQVSLHGRNRIRYDRANLRLKAVAAEEYDSTPPDAPATKPNFLTVVLPLESLLSKHPCRQW